MDNQFYIPLMSDPIQKDDILALKEFLDEENIPRLSNGQKVEEAERAFADWLGVKYAVLVNSGSSANELTMMWVRQKFGECSVVVPPLTWVSDWAAILHAGLTPITCDIKLSNLSFDIDRLRESIRPDTRVIFLTHVLGLSAITPELLELCREKDLVLIEDCCETVGATYGGKKVGTFGRAANWSGFVAHHFSTIEGGIVTTDDEEMYEYLRAARAHGMNRELKSPSIKQRNIAANPRLNKDFIFLFAAHNFRPTEIQGVLLSRQLKKLDKNNEFRRKWFEYFIKNLDPFKYETGFNIAGQCAYSFIVILKDKSLEARDKLEQTLSEHKIEFRRGCSGGGSQLEQPYLKGVVDYKPEDFPVMSGVHQSSCYIGLYPALAPEKITNLLRILNSIDF